MLQAIKTYLGKVRRRNKRIAYYLVSLFQSPPAFTFRGKTYRQFWHLYNATWRNERAVEVPIIWEEVSRARGARVLEVGNVLSHYFSVSHPVLDKYERAAGVLNEDVCSFSPGRQFDLIVSISTLEHVGWDEIPKQPERVLGALGNLLTLLAPGGRIMVTLPLGYNQPLDAWIHEGRIVFTDRRYLRRVSAGNQWREVSYREVQGVSYDEITPTANAILIGTIQKT
jgi:SAM-dependent methyltransferase